MLLVQRKVTLNSELKKRFFSNKRVDLLNTN